MKNGANKKVNKKYFARLFVFISLLILAAFSMDFVQSTYAKYKLSANGEDSTKIAAFNIESNLTAAASEINLENIKPGFQQTVNFRVTNASDVSVAYEFEVSTSENLPLVFNFSDNGAGQLQLNGEMSAVHTLTISWPLSMNDASYAYEIDAVIVSLICTQID